MIYQYKAKVINVVDGDTVDLEIDLGFYIIATKRARLRGINTPELHSPDPKIRLGAIIARDRVTRFVVDNNRKVIVNTELDRSDKYGRILVEVFPPYVNVVEGGPNTIPESLNNILLKEGLAVSYYPS